MIGLPGSPSASRLRDALSGGRGVPRLVKAGAAAILFGVVFDLSEHSIALPAAAAGPGFSPGEHAAHLVVLIGMAAILVGIVADGVRSTGRHARQEGSPRNAVR